MLLLRTALLPEAAPVALAELLHVHVSVEDVLLEEYEMAFTAVPVPDGVIWPDAEERYLRSS